MKFAPMYILLSLFLISFLSCKSDAKENKSPVQDQESVVPDKEQREDLKAPRPEHKLEPIERKSDRTIKKEKEKSALDTLRPKTV